MAAKSVTGGLARWLPCIVLVTLFLSSFAISQSAPAVPIGRIVDAPYVDRYWQECRLAELRSCRGVVLYFATVECPMVARTLPKIGRLAEAGLRQNLAVVVVNVGAGDLFVEAVGQATLMAPSARFAWDRPQGLAAACGVLRTNTAVLLDAEGRLRYRGRVDGAGYAGRGTAMQSNNLDAAIEQMLGGGEVTPTETSVSGCLLTPPSVASGDSPPTFFQHIAPLLDQYCAACHTDAENSGIRLASPTDLERHANMLGEVVDNGRMPPRFAAKTEVPFINQRSLTAEDLAMVRAWMAAGRPRGQEHPIQRHPPHLDWQVGEVDRILELPVGVAIPASGVGDYFYAVLPDRFVTDTWVEALEVRTTVPRAWRHCNVAIVSGETYDPACWVANATPHAQAWQAWPGTALRIPAGHRLALQLYCEPTGVDCEAFFKVGLRYPRWEVRREVQVASFGKDGLVVPAGDSAFRVEAGWVAPTDGEGFGIFVHMHGRGRDVRVVERHSAGERALLWVPTYSFAMQSYYSWPRSEMTWAAGSSFLAVGHFDNSAANPANPNPLTVAQSGPLLGDEQFLASVMWLPRRETKRIKVNLQTGSASAGD